MSSTDSLKVHDAENVVRAIGLVFNNMSLYSPEHSVTKQALEDCYAFVSKTLDQCTSIRFLISDDSLSLNDTSIELKNPLMKMFVTHLYSRDITNFSFNKGLSRDHFLKVIDILMSKPAELKAFGGFTAALKQFEVVNVVATKVTYQQVTEEELVIAKTDLDKLAEGASADSQTIIAFLKGTAESDDAVAGGLKNLAADPEKLGELIMKAADVAERPADVSSGETLGDLVVGCLNKAKDIMANDPAMKSQKAKKDLKKTLLLLERDLLARMHDVSGVCNVHDEEVLHEAVETMVDELEIESLAADYMKKRNAIEVNENRILRFLRSKGLDRIKDTDLEAKLKDGGLSMDGWGELLVKSGVSADGSGGGIVAVGHLAMLLDQMEENIHQIKGGKTGGDGDDSDGIATLMLDVDKEVQKMVAQTEKKINDLVAQVRRDEQEEDGGNAVQVAGEVKLPKEKSMTRKKLLENLAEIVQELCQPIAVIHCTIEMILAGCVGDVSDPQKDMLNLADESGKKLQRLIDHLLMISGVPKTLKPDAKIQDSIYK